MDHGAHPLDPRMAAEAFQAVAQEGPAGKRQILLGPSPPKALTAAARHDQRNTRWHTGLHNKAGPGRSRTLGRGVAPAKRAGGLPGSGDPL
jgi:hypothetical protein